MATRTWSHWRVVCCLTHIGRYALLRSSVLMWKVRAHRTLARAYARLGQIKPALTHYQHLLAATDFLTGLPLSDGRQHDAIAT